jgi:hypothetical protein
VARESSAEFTSNDGFSVVAPMKVKSPDSTCGRNASCWALLKRCTSSTNTTVFCPAARPARACSTASRISLTPPRTAGHRQEAGVEGGGDEPRQGRLADARRPPEDHRVQPPGLEGDAQRLARAQQVLLADDLVERPRAQALSERRVRGARLVLERSQQVGHANIRVPWEMTFILPPVTGLPRR